MGIRVRCLCGNLLSEGEITEKGVVYVRGTKVRVQMLELDYVRVITPKRQVIDLDLQKAYARSVSSGSVLFTWKI